MRNAWNEHFCFFVWEICGTIMSTLRERVQCPSPVRFFLDSNFPHQWVFCLWFRLSPHWGWVSPAEFQKRIDLGGFITQIPSDPMELLGPNHLIRWWHQKCGMHEMSISAFLFERFAGLLFDRHTDPNDHYRNVCYRQNASKKIDTITWWGASEGMGFPKSKIWLCA